MVKKLILIIILLGLVNQVYSETYISEINFIDEEFIEIYSDEYLNLSNKKVYDDNGFEKFNTLSDQSLKNSSYYLIIGQNFHNKYDTILDDLNCSIYVTDKTQVSSGGLKSSGEDLIVEISNQTYLSWTKDKSYSFNTNETLNYDSSNSSYFIFENSLCSKPSLQINSEGSETSPVLNLTNQTIFNESETLNQSSDDTLNETNEINSSTLTNTTYNLNLTNCDYFFGILTDKYIFEDKIEFNFETNATNFSINYWIENYAGEIKKSKKTTKNTNSKFYTPSAKTEVYRIYANLNISTCNIINESKLVTFYSYSDSYSGSHVESSSSSSGISTCIKDKSKPNGPYIFLPNLQDFLSKKTKELQYEIYRGDSTKRTFYIHLDKNKMASFELESKSKLKGRIHLDIENANTLSFNGLDLLKTYNLTNFTEKEETNISVSKSFKIAEFLLTNNTVILDVSSTIDDLDSVCYITYIRTHISNEIFNQTGSLHFVINDSKLASKEVLDSYPLKVICKYKNSSLKNYRYENLEFDYSINSFNTTENIISAFDNFSNTNLSFFSEFNTNNVKNSNSIQELIPGENSQNTNKTDLIYDSNKSKNFRYGIYFFALAVVTLLILFIIKR